MKILKNPKLPIILAFDTSCDETSVAVVQGRKVLSSVVSSQVELHKKWGGVVPDIARRAHIENIPKSYKEALKRAKVSAEDIDAVAATIGPGLAIDLEIGIQFAKDFAVKYSKPFIPVNHMEGHLMSGLLLNSKGNGDWKDLQKDMLPGLAMLISGKHTEIIYFDEFGKYEKIGQTLDDAAGEAFDKVGRMLGFGYPGGPVVEEFAKKGKAGGFGLPIPMERSGDLNFSYSGLKTACLYRLKDLRESGKKDKDFVHDFCRSFIESIAKSLTIKLKAAFKQYPNVKTLYTGGGVYKNQIITRRIGKLAREYGLNYVLPDLKYRSDNAAMIGIAAWRMFNDGEIVSDEKEFMELDRVPRLSL